METHLRPYQLACLEAIRDRKVNRGIVSIATGGGKGHIMPFMPNYLGLDDGVLFLAHRRELITQLARHVARTHGAHSVSIEQADQRARRTPFVVASVDTLHERRLQRLTDRFEVKAIALDEAHHGTSPKYLKLWRHFGVMVGTEEEKNGKTRTRWAKGEGDYPPLIGWTATPSRGDGVGLHNVFDDVLYSYPLERCIADGYLVPIRAFSIETGETLSGVRVQHGDFVDADLARRVNTERRTARIIKAQQDHAKGLKTLVFGVDRAHIAAIAEAFRVAGLEANHVDGTMGMDERDRAFNWFRRTPEAVLVACQLVDEGVDIPSVEAVLMGAPTLSAVRYSQRLGRGTRLAHGARDYEESCRLGKRELVLLDVVDTLPTTGKQAVSVMSIFGAPLPGQKLSGQDVMQEVARQRHVIEEQEAKAKAAKARVVELFGPMQRPPGASMLWHKYGDGYMLTLPDRSAIRVVTNTLDQWVAERSEQGKSGWARSETMPPVGDLGLAIVAVERWVSANKPKERILLSADAPWREAGPTDKQLQFARRLGLPIPAGVTKGQLSDAINRVMAQRRAG